MVEERCVICGSDEVVMAGPLSIEGERVKVANISGKQCTLCGNLQVMIPQPVLVRWYPPDVRRLTLADHQRAHWRRRSRRM